MKHIFFKGILTIGLAALLLSCPSTPPPPANDFDVNPKYNKPSLEINRKLFFAVKNNDITTVRECLQGDANPEVADMLGQDVLMWSVWNGNGAIVRLLVEEKSIVFKNKSKSILSIFKKDIPLYPDIGAKNRYGYTAPHCAAYKDRADIYRYLKNAYERIGGTKWRAVIQSTDEAGETILHKAVKSGSPDMLNLCLEENISGIINKPDRLGYTPLHLAVVLNYSDMVSYLLNKGSDAAIGASVEYQETKHTTYPLLSAYEKRGYGIFCQLLEAMNIDDIERVTVLGLNNNEISLSDYIGQNIDAAYNTYHESDNERFEQIKRETERYRESINRRKSVPPQPAYDPEYAKELWKLFNAVRDGKSLTEIRELAGPNGEYIREVDFELKENKPLIHYAVDNAITTADTVTLNYLLNSNIHKKETVLLYACKQWSESSKENIVRIISNLVDNRVRFNLNIGYQEEGIGSSQRTILMYILDNDEFCNRLWENGRLRTVLVACEQSGTLMSSFDANINDLRYYALKSNSGFRNDIFDYLFDYLISRNPDPKIDGQESPVIFALEKGFYYAAEKMLKADIGIAFERDKEAIKNKITDIRSSLPKNSKDDDELLAKCLGYIDKRIQNTAVNISSKTPPPKKSK